MKKETVLLTGITGYIGLHCAKQLLEADWQRVHIHTEEKGQLDGVFGRPAIHTRGGSR